MFRASRRAAGFLPVHTASCFSQFPARTKTRPHFPHPGMANRLLALRRKLEKRARTARAARVQQAKRIVLRSVGQTQKRENERTAKRRDFCRVHGALFYRKMCQAGAYARICEPLAAVGVWNALYRHRKNPTAPQKGSLCADTLRIMRNKLKTYREKHPSRYKVHTENTRHAIDRALLYADDSHLDDALRICIPNAWKKMSKILKNTQKPQKPQKSSKCVKNRNGVCPAPQEKRAEALGHHHGSLVRPTEL